MERRRRFRGRACLALAVLACGCAIGVREPQIHEPAAPPAAAGARSELKVHLRSGELLALRTWKVAPGEDRLTGEGQAYTLAREKKGPPGRHDVPLADVALLETSSPESVTSLGLGVIATTTVVLGGLTGYCVINPKGCFGSCPTFYVEGAGGGEPGGRRPRASRSRSPGRWRRGTSTRCSWTVPAGRTSRVVMRNEALETHAVRRVRLLAVARGRPAAASSPGPTTASTPRRRSSRPSIVPCARGGLPGHAACRRRDGSRLARRRRGPRGARGDRAPLPGREGPGRHRDRRAADPPLDVPLLPDHGLHRPRGRDFLAALERGGPEAGRRALGMARVLGGIDVEVAEGDAPWRAIGTFDEAGPIAGDLRVVPFRGLGRRPAPRAAAPRAGALAPRRGRARGASGRRSPRSGSSPPRRARRAAATRGRGRGSSTARGTW